ncbi:MAG: hypothetical protein IH994_03760 [Proteobacteria bacterium]|nr:hypothetical protein [Pseudomonadota bacterium]
MAIGRALAIAVSGINANGLRANVAATNIVNQNTPGFKAGEIRAVSRQPASSAAGGSGVTAQIIESGRVDLALEFNRLIEAEAAYRAGVGVIQGSEEIERDLVDVIA